MGVSKNKGTPKSSILIGISILNHPFWGTPIFGNIHMGMKSYPMKLASPNFFDRSTFISSKVMILYGFCDEKKLTKS